MALQLVVVAGLATLGCSNVLALDAFEDAEATSTTSSASATASSSGSGGAGGAAASGTSSDASTGAAGGGGAASTSTGAGGSGGAGGAGPSDCAEAVASGLYNACVDPSGRFYWGLATIYAGGSPLPDAQVAAGEWGASLWALGDPLNGTKLTLVLESPGVARMDLPAGLPEGLCPYHQGAQRHPLRVGSPERSGVYGLAGDASNKQPGLLDSLPDQTGGNWGPTFAVARDSQGVYPAATLAHEDMVGAQGECSP